MISYGDIVQVVLDVAHVSGPDDFEGERVLVQGVFPLGCPLPKPRPGVTRNVVEVFFGMEMRSVSAFLMETGIGAEQPATDPRPGQEESATS